MMETLDRKDRKARKEHRCDYCSEIISKGEVYDWSKHVFDGELYEWKCHKKCSFIARELWEYINPDEGMTEDDFYYGCQEFCRAFVCPDCPCYDRADRECKEDKAFCTEKIYQFLRTHEFFEAGRDGWVTIWKCKIKREGERIE